jgi:hypothetical protein
MVEGTREEGTKWIIQELGLGHLSAWMISPT